jgi:hypothetical protein
LGPQEKEIMGSETTDCNVEQYEVLTASSYEEVISKTRFRLGATARVVGLRVISGSNNRWTVLPIFELDPNTKDIAEFSNDRNLKKIVKIFTKVEEKSKEHVPLKSSVSSTKTIQTYLRKQNAKTSEL